MLQVTRQIQVHQFYQEGCYYVALWFDFFAQRSFDADDRIMIASQR